MDLVSLTFNLEPTKFETVKYVVLFNTFCMTFWTVLFTFLTIIAEFYRNI